MRHAPSIAILGNLRTPPWTSPAAGLAQQDPDNSVRLNVYVSSWCSVDAVGTYRVVVQSVRFSSSPWEVSGHG